MSYNGKFPLRREIFLKEVIILEWLSAFRRKNTEYGFGSHRPSLRLIVRCDAPFIVLGSDWAFLTKGTNKVYLSFIERLLSTFRNSFVFINSQ